MSFLTMSKNISDKEKKFCRIFSNYIKSFGWIKLCDYDSENSHNQIFVNSTIDRLINNKL